MCKQSHSFAVYLTATILHLAVHVWPRFHTRQRRDQYLKLSSFSSSLTALSSVTCTQPPQLAFFLGPDFTYILQGFQNPVHRDTAVHWKSGLSYHHHGKKKQGKRSCCQRQNTLLSPICPQILPIESCRASFGLNIRMRDNSHIGRLQELSSTAGPVFHCRE